MLWRIFVAAALIFAAMLAVKDGRVLRGAGLTGSCSSIVAPAGQTGVWKVCKQGRLDGRPDLSRHSCKAVSVSGKLEYWRCPAAIGSSIGS